MSEQDSILTAKIEMLRRTFIEKLAERRSTMAGAVETFMQASDAATRREALEALEHVAHQISGSGALFGCEPLGLAAETLERTCRETRVAPLSPGLETKLARDWRATADLIDTAQRA